MNADDLYGLPLDRFVPERDALAKQLRRAGEREEASRVSALRKPSVAAWAVNQLVRTQRRAVSALFEAGDTLQVAQAQLVAGNGGGEALRDTSNREQEAVSRLTATARGLLSGEGHELSSATLERVAETLQAAALEDAAREQVTTGCLDRELRHVGFGSVAPSGRTFRRKPKPGKPKRPSRPSAAEPETSAAQPQAPVAAKETPEPLVRLATTKDAPAIGRLLDAFNREFKEPTPGPRRLSRRIAELLPTDTTVLLAGRGPDGLAVLRFRPALWNAGLEAYLAELYVVPKRRRRGLGRALMTAALETARERGADRIELGTSEEDEAARRLYESLGFVNRERGGEGPVMFVYEREL